MKEIGAEKTFDGEIYDMYWDFDDNSLRNSKTTLRIRKEGSKPLLTFKKPVSQERAKIREECELEISNYKKMQSILESLGFKPWLVIRKNRVSYKLDDVHFDIDHFLDKYSYIPDYLEIESEDVKTVYKYVDLLGFDRKDCKSWTFVETAQHYSD